MKKGVKNSYDLDTEAQKSVVEQGLTISYFNNTLGAIKNLGITSVRDVPHDKSDLPSTHLLNALLETKYWLNNLAESYAKENTQFTGLESMLQDDPLSKAAATYHWNGLFPSADKDSPEHYQYTAFSVVWQYEKTAKFMELVKNHWNEKKSKPAPAQPGLIKRTFNYLGRRVLDTAVIALVLAPPIYAVSKYVVVPQTANYLIETVRPEIRTELALYYSTHGQINIKEVSEGLLREFPRLKMFQAHLESAVKEEAQKLEQEQKQQQEQQPPEEKSQPQEEEF